MKAMLISARAFRTSCRAENETGSSGRAAGWQGVRARLDFFPAGLRLMDQRKDFAKSSEVALATTLVFWKVLFSPFSMRRLS